MTSPLHSFEPALCDDNNAQRVRPPRPAEPPSGPFEYVGADDAGAPGGYAVSLAELPTVTPEAHAGDDEVTLRTPNGFATDVPRVSSADLYEQAANYLALAHAVSAYEAAIHDEEVQALANAFRENTGLLGVVTEALTSPQFFENLHAAGFRAPEVQA